jgi:hypothetical protein
MTADDDDFDEVIRSFPPEVRREAARQFEAMARSGQPWYRNLWQDCVDALFRRRR